MNWIILAFISAALSAAAAVYEKKALFKIDALEFSFILSFFSLLFSLPFFAAFSFSDLSTASLLVLLIKTLLGAFAFWNVMLAIKNLEISAALPLIVLTPGLVGIFAYFLLGESLGNFEIVGILLLLLGTYLLEMNEKWKKIFDPFMIFIRSKNHHYIIFALLLFTATSLIDKVLVIDFKMPPTAFMALQHLFQFVFFLLIVLLLKGRASISIHKGIEKNIWKIILLIALFTILYRWTQIEAVKIAPVALVLSIKRTSTFFASVIGGTIFKEKNLLKRATATLIMIIGALLIINS